MLFIMRYARLVKRATFSVLIFVIFFRTIPASAEEDNWWSADKGYHFSVSFALAGVCYAALWRGGDDPQAIRPLLATSLAIIPGLAKEVYDAGQKGNHFSGRDLIWDVLGATSGSLLLFAAERIVAKHRPPQKSNVYLQFNGSSVAIRSAF